MVKLFVNKKFRLFTKVIAGIISTYEPASFSIEGFIYLAPIGGCPTTFN
ncbi:MAG: hypothetical protein FWE21_04825 [Defluviitaleaceae bacterium]|nr:hypothetical protein [Defluviitaleaceae bacterium]